MSTMEQHEAALRQYIRSLPPEAFDFDRLTIDNLPLPVPAEVRAQVEALPAEDRRFLLWMTHTLAGMPDEKRVECGIQTVESGHQGGAR